MINLEQNVSFIEIYYDGRCGMCCTFHEWLNRQDHANKVYFYAYQDEAAEVHFAELKALDPAREMVVRVEGVDVHRGAEGWLWCLWSCQKYRALASWWNRPLLLPFAKKLCYVLAANRLPLSKVFFSKKNKEVEKNLHEMPNNDIC